MSKTIIIRCIRGVVGYHRWRVIRREYANGEHWYTERKCVYCGVFESEVR